MHELETIIKRLANMNLRSVSREIDLHYMTVYNVANGRIKQPSYRTVKILSDFLDKVAAA